MGELENKKLFAHYTSRAAGSYKSGNSVQDQLIVSDANKHLADLIKKNPSLILKEKAEVEEVKETKSKKKKNG